MVEGDNFLLSMRTVGIMLPLSEVRRTESGPVADKGRWVIGVASPPASTGVIGT